MAAMVCKACQDYAATSGGFLCGNCALLSPEDLATATKDGAARAKVRASGRPQDQMAMLAQLQQENAQLKANQQSAAKEKKEDDDEPHRRGR